MKKTDLEKVKALKLVGKMKQQAGAAGRPVGTQPAVDRREQRKLDQSLGLVSFPLKLKQPLIDALRARATERDISVNDVVAELLEQALKG